MRVLLILSLIFFVALFNGCNNDGDGLSTPLALLPYSPLGGDGNSRLIIEVTNATTGEVQTGGTTLEVTNATTGEVQTGGTTQGQYLLVLNGSEYFIFNDDIFIIDNLEQGFYNLNLYRPGFTPLNEYIGLNGGDNTYNFVLSVPDKKYPNYYNNIYEEGKIRRFLNSPVRVYVGGFIDVIERKYYRVEYEERGEKIVRYTDNPNTSLDELVNFSLAGTEGETGVIFYRNTNVGTILEGSDFGRNEANNDYDEYIVRGPIDVLVPIERLRVLEDGTTTREIVSIKVMVSEVARRVGYDEIPNYYSYFLRKLMDSKSEYIDKYEDIINSMQDDFNEYELKNLFRELVVEAINQWHSAIGDIGFEFTDDKDDADISVFITLSRSLLNEDDIKDWKYENYGRVYTIDFNEIEGKYLYGLRPMVMVNPLNIVTYDGVWDRDMFLRIIMHEIGHALGIWGHSPYSTDIMYDFTVDDIMRFYSMEPTLSRGDINTIKYLYSISPNYTNLPFDRYFNTDIIGEAIK